MYVQFVRCIMYKKNIYFVDTFHVYQCINITHELYLQRIGIDYTRYKIHIFCMLCVKCVVYLLYTIQYTLLYIQDTL